MLISLNNEHGKDIVFDFLTAPIRTPSFLANISGAQEMFFLGSCMLTKTWHHVSFSFLKFWSTSVLVVGSLISLFWTSGDVSYEFQSHSGQPYSHLVAKYMICVP